MYDVNQYVEVIRMIWIKMWTLCGECGSTFWSFHTHTSTHYKLVVNNYLFLLFCLLYLLLQVRNNSYTICGCYVYDLDQMWILCANLDQYVHVLHVMWIKRGCYVYDLDQYVDVQHVIMWIKCGCYVYDLGQYLDALCVMWIK